MSKRNKRNRARNQRQRQAMALAPAGIRGEAALVNRRGAQGLRLYGIVGDWFDGFTDEDVARLMESVEDGPLSVYINSPGGIIYQGMAIHSLLTDHEGEVTIIVDGLAASMGASIAMAGDRVLMYPGAMMMIHNPLNMTVGDSREMRKSAEVLDKHRDALVAMIQDKTGLEESRIIEMLDAETWLTAQEAVDLGFADEIIGADEPEESRARVDTAMASLNLSGFDYIPGQVQAAVARAGGFQNKRQGATTMATGKTPKQSKRNRSQTPASNGPALAELLNNAIDAIDGDGDDERSRDDVVTEIAEAAGLSVEQVNQILDADTMCPAMGQMESFASVDGMPTMEDQREAAEADGCEYEDSDGDGDGEGDEGDGDGDSEGSAGTGARNVTMPKNQQELATMIDKARAAGVRSERNRVKGVLAAGDQAKRQDAALDMVRDGTSVSQARATLLAALAAGSEGQGISNKHTPPSGRQRKEDSRLASRSVYERRVKAQRSGGAQGTEGAR